MKLYGADLFGEPMAPTPGGPLAAKFGIPPFSILDTRQGEWQERKNAWLAVGIKSEVGREADCLPDVQSAASYMPQFKTGTSVFDPVLCELAYRWWCPVGGQVVDPFAGGSVRGVVANMLGHQYWGCELRAEQVDANQEQGAALCQDPRPVWVCGDSMEVVKQAPDADFIFTCPPYGDLETYSDHPRDISNMEYIPFLSAYGEILCQAFARLRPDRFACIVVGDFRDKATGHYRGFVARTVELCRVFGLQLYNEAVLVTTAGSLPIRVSAQFDASRKLGKTHQNVLVFVKGDGKQAARAMRPQGGDDAEEADTTAGTAGVPEEEEAEPGSPGV